MDLHVAELRQCRSCLYFQKSNMEGAAENAGTCHKKPPVVFLVPSMNKMGGPPQPVPIAAFPPVTWDIWCGDWSDARTVN